jgi:hypothetical protein
VNIANYKRRKAAGNVKLGKQDDNTFGILSRRYDPDTGEETSPELTHINLAGVKEQRQRLADELAAIDELIADLEKTTEPLYSMDAKPQRSRASSQ